MKKIFTALIFFLLVTNLTGCFTGDTDKTNTSEDSIDDTYKISKVDINGKIEEVDDEGYSENPEDFVADYLQIVLDNGKVRCLNEISLGYERAIAIYKFNIEESILSYTTSSEDNNSSYTLSYKNTDYHGSTNGTYSLSAVEIEGKTYQLDEDNVNSYLNTSDTPSTIEIDNDEITIIYTKTGTYEASDSSITVTFDGKTSTWEYDDGTLSFTDKYDFIEYYTKQ